MTVDSLRVRLAVAAALLCCASASQGDSSSATDPTVADKTVIATVGGQKVTAADIVSKNKDAFDQLKSQRDQQVRQAEHEYSSAYHESVEKDLGDYLDQRALELEAADKHTTPTALLDEVKASVVTDQEARAVYEAHKDQVHKPYEAVAGEIKQFLAKQHSDSALRAYYDDLRKKHGVTDTLQPYRVAVAATGPARGKASAPITIVEFADFECPYCREAEASLQAVIDKHPNDVRLVFRHRPLAELHPNAVGAARAAVCADQQGKFWEMHDAMFKDQSALGTEALKDTAGRLGMDKTRFASCLDAPDTVRALSADNQAAVELGVNSTPYFFVDGMPVRGSQTAEQFEKIIDDELARGPKGRG
jgi:protein-disulfide isomerase